MSRSTSTRTSAEERIDGFGRGRADSGVNVLWFAGELLLEGNVGWGHWLLLLLLMLVLEGMRDRKTVRDAGGREMWLLGVGASELVAALD